MTEKQENILKAALMLFATQGYASTSTSKVAKAAGVSEGLIFRHFGNKEGLLNAILEMASQAMEQKMATVVMAPSPKEILTRLFEMLFSIEDSEHEMWKLVYALKWQTHSYDAAKYASLKLVLHNAFQQLSYDDPAAETELVFMIMDGVATSFLLHPPENKQDILKALKKKYEL